MASDDPQCRHEYTRPGGRQPGDRAVHCDLTAGHDGPHQESETCSWWPNVPPPTAVELEELKRRFLATAHLPAVVLPAYTPDQAHAAGYAQAVARLRDGAKYTNWAYGDPREPHAQADLRNHLAAYLEAVGPGTQPTGGAAVEAGTPIPTGCPECQRKHAAGADGAGHG